MAMKLSRAAILVLSAGLIATVLWRPLRRKEPEHDGKPVSYWMEQMLKSRVLGEDEAYRALKAMGAEAVPFLVATLHKKNSAYSKIVPVLYRMVPQALPLLDRLPPPVDSLEVSKLIELLVAVGPGATNAMPDFPRWIEHGDREMRFYVPEVISATGRAGLPWAPQLMRLGVHKVPEVRLAALKSLAGIAEHGMGACSNAIVAVFRKAEEDTFDEVQDVAHDFLLDVENPRVKEHQE